MAEFKPYAQEQGMLFPPHLGDLIPENHLVRVVNEIVEQLDLREITQKYPYRGAEGYHPRMLVKILFYGYATGIFSSRKIAAYLGTDITFMWLAAMQRPDFRTISDFRKNHRPIIEDLFIQIVKIGMHMGLVNLGHVSLDGSKINADASKHKAMSRVRLKQEIPKLQKEIEALLDKAEQADQEEDKDNQDPHDGNILPEELSCKQKRLAKLQQALEELNERQPEQDAKNQEEADKQQINFTDSESRIMVTRHHGVQQAYNPQIAVDKENGLIVGAVLTNSPVDKEQLIPTLKHLEEVTGKLPEQLTADAGYFSADNIRFCNDQNIDAYIASTKEGKQDGNSFDKTNFNYDPEKDIYTCPEGKELQLKTKTTTKKGKTHWVYQGIDCPSCPFQSQCVKAKSGIRQVTRTEDDPIREAMRTKVQSAAGQEVYQKRKGIVEPVWGQIKAIQGFRQFSFRGIDANKAEMFLVAIGHNLRKIFFSTLPKKKGKTPRDKSASNGGERVIQQINMALV